MSKTQKSCGTCSRDVDTCDEHSVANGWSCWRPILPGTPLAEAFEGEKWLAVGDKLSWHQLSRNTICRLVKRGSRNSAVSVMTENDWCVWNSEHDVVDLKAITKKEAASILTGGCFSRIDPETGKETPLSEIYAERTPVKVGVGSWLIGKSGGVKRLRWDHDSKRLRLEHMSDARTFSPSLAVVDASNMTRAEMSEISSESLLQLRILTTIEAHDIMAKGGADPKIVSQPADDDIEAALKIEPTSFGEGRE